MSVPDAGWFVGVVDVSLVFAPLPEAEEANVPVVELSEPPEPALFELPATGCVGVVPVDDVCVPVAALVALSTLEVSVVLGVPAFVSVVPDVVVPVGGAASKSWS